MINDIGNKLDAAYISNNNEDTGPKQTRAAKRRAKKTAKEQEREQRIADGEQENINCARNVEVEKLKHILKERNLEIYEVNKSHQTLVFFSLLYTF